MKFIETTESAWSAEQLAAAEREIENQKREWEQNRLAAMKEEEERRHRELEEESELLTFSRDDAANQVSLKSKRLGVRSQTSKSFKKRRKMVKTKIELSSDLNVKEKKFVKKNNKPKKETDQEKVEKETTPAIVNNSQDSEESQTIDESSRLSEEMNETSLDSNESEGSGKINFSHRSIINKLDHNSPRTRSRGTVAINLWTLDVSPILPGEKPTRKLPRLESADKDDENSKSRRNSLSESDVRSDEEKDDKVIATHKNQLHKLSNDINIESSCKERTCTVELCDILMEDEYVFPKVVCYSTRDFEKPMEMIQKHGDEIKPETNTSGNEDKINPAVCTNDEMEDVNKKSNAETEKTTSQTVSEVQSPPTNTANHVINHKEKTIQSKLLSESMLNEKLVREEIKKSLHVEANFDTKFHIPKKPSPTEVLKDLSDTADDKLQLSDISDGEFSVNDNSNSDFKFPLKNTNAQEKSSSRLFVTTSSYQETFKSYVQNQHRPSSFHVSTNSSSSSITPQSSSSTPTSSAVVLTNSLHISNNLNTPMNNCNASTASFNSSMNSSNSSLNTSDSFVDSSNVPTQSGGTSNFQPKVPQKHTNQRRFYNHRYHQDYNRKHNKFRNKNYTLDNWLNSSKDGKGRKHTESNCRDTDGSHRDTKNNSFS